MDYLDELTLLGVVLVLTPLLGLATAVDAIMHARTPQGGIAWALTLVYLPYFALPAYWIFGRSKFEGYIDARRMESQEIRGITYTFRRFEARFVGIAGDQERIVRKLHRPRRERMAQAPAVATRVTLGRPGLRGHTGPRGGLPLRPGRRGDRLPR